MAKRKKKQIPPTRLAVEEHHIDWETTPGWVQLHEEVLLHTTERLPNGIYGRMAFIGGSLNVVFRYSDVQNDALGQTWAEWKTQHPSAVAIPAYDISSLRGYYKICYAPENEDLTEWFLLGGLEVATTPKMTKERKVFLQAGADPKFLDLLD